MKRLKHTFIWSALTLFLFTGIVACNDDAIFEKEMYKHVLSLVSTKDYNIFKEIVPLTGEETDGYISASCGGTIPTDKDITLSLVEDMDPFEFYNWSLFDADADQYAKLLPKEKYEIEKYEILIEKGKRAGRTRVKINPNGLSPDSTYFIALKIDSSSGYEINKTKNTILYQVLIENKYASQDDKTLYRMTGFIDSAVTAGNVLMLPLTKNKVRIMAGTEAFQAKLDVINKAAIVLEVTNPETDSSHVIISSYKDIIVNQLDGDPQYPNIYKREEDNFGRVFNTFLLSYEYTINGTVRLMKEELRMEVVKTN